MNPHNWLNRVSWEVWVYNVTSLWFFGWAWLLSCFAEAENYDFFTPKWWNQCLAGEFTNLSQKCSVFPIPLTLFQCQTMSMLACIQIHIFLWVFFSLQVAFFRFLCWIFPSAQIRHKLKLCNIITPNNKPPNNKPGKKKYIYKKNQR